MIELFGQTFDLDNPQSTYFHGDCMEGMAHFPDKYFNLAVVDPPYGIGMAGGKVGGALAEPQNYHRFAGDDIQPPDTEYFNELRRVAQNQVVFGANHFISRIPIDSPCWLVWDKQQTAHFADAELAWTSFKSHVSVFRYRWNGMLQENMKHKEHKMHPSQKPVALYRWIFDKYTERGMKVLDTHVGSASSLIAAHDAGLTFVGFELDDYYYEKSKQRLDDHMAQMTIYDFLQEDEP